jgi:hypothetical protein
VHEPGFECRTGKAPNTTRICCVTSVEHNNSMKRKNIFRRNGTSQAGFDMDACQRTLLRSRQDSHLAINDVPNAGLNEELCTLVARK